MIRIFFFYEMYDDSVKNYALSDLGYYNMILKN